MGENFLGVPGNLYQLAVWSSGMILAQGARGLRAQFPEQRLPLHCMWGLSLVQDPGTAGAVQAQ